MKKHVLHTLGLAAIAALLCVFCGDNSPDGTAGGEVDALLSRFYNNETPGTPNVTTYTVKFHANGGTGTAPASIPVSANNSITLPDKGNMSNGELVFGGWNTKSDGTGTNYPANAGYTVTGDITLYAKWNVASTGGGDEPGLVLAEGEAWVLGNSGYIFTADNRVFEIRKRDGDGNWIADTGTYNISGTIITINSTAGTYTISGNMLYLSMCSCTFERTSGIVTVPKYIYTSFTDSRDSKTYKKVEIGTQIWMAENLNYNAGGSVCYDSSDANCAKYGRLYNWETAMGGKPSSSVSPSGVQGVCPAGWHLPSDAEWTVLTDYVGGASTAGKKLKSTSGWNSYQGVSGNGTDDYGFTALPGGYGGSDGSFNDAGDNGNWWSATEGDANGARYRNMDCNDEDVGWDDGGKTGLFSVRCAQD